MPTNGTNGTGDGGSDEPAISIVNTLSIIIVLGFMGMIPLWMWFPPMTSDGVLAIINMLIGSLLTAFATVIGYHFGSSKSSKDAQRANRETMTSLASTAATAASTAAAVAGVVAPPAPPSAPPLAPGEPAAPLAGAAGPSETEKGAALTAAEAAEGGQIHVEGDVAVTGAAEGATGKPTERGAGT